MKKKKKHKHTQYKTKRIKKASQMHLHMVVSHDTVINILRIPKKKKTENKKQIAMQQYNTVENNIMNWKPAVNAASFVVDFLPQPSGPTSNTWPLKIERMH